ncbi:type II toxin-antitoxin system RelE/ParE family toxin [Candidatus Pacearchaeota archaeon]|nr:type II toxin-antitoxin system RelE/ParE family toxin [Candidatus Pacearchaeota archaeon]
MKYEVRYDPKAEEQLRKLPKEISERIIKKMRYVGETGQGIEVLKDEQYGFKIRVCDYRVLVDIVNNPNTIIVRYVDKRGRIYKRLFLNF